MILCFYKDNKIVNDKKQHIDCHANAKRSLEKRF